MGAVEGRQIGIRGVVVDAAKANFTHSDNRTNLTLVGNMGMVRLADMAISKMVM